MNEQPPNSLNFHFDRDQLLERVGGNTDLLPKLVSIGKNNFTIYLEDVQKQLEAKDFEGIKKSAHKLKGSALSLSLGTLSKLAASLEECESITDSTFTKLITSIEEEINYLNENL